jgi:hypothetical protein
MLGREAEHHLVAPMLRMRGAIPPLPQLRLHDVVLSYAQGQLYLFPLQENFMHSRRQHWIQMRRKLFWLYPHVKTLPSPPGGSQSRC